MTPDQLKAAREKLGLSQVAFAKALGVSLRAVGGWEQGTRNGRSTTIPETKAKLVEMALRNPTVRRELGIGKGKAEWTLERSLPKTKSRLDLGKALAENEAGPWKDLAEDEDQA